MTFSLKGLEVQITAEWPFWISSDLLVPEGSQLPGHRCIGCCIPQQASEGHLKVLLRQGDFLLETALGKDGIKQFEGKNTPLEHVRCLHGVSSGDSPQH